MKIFVLSKNRMQKMIESEGVNSEDFYITVKCPLDADFAIEENSENVLKLEFDDVVSTQDSDTPFDNSMANLVSEFFFRMLRERKKCSKLFVNCGAGISRSGAIGEAANIFFNKLKEQNDKDYYEFYDVNPQIQPNLLVKNMLMKRILF